MSDETERDPMRALDPVVPPDRWDDIVGATSRPAVEPVPSPAAGNGARRPLLLAAAIVLVVAGVGGALALAGRDDGGDEVTTTPAAEAIEGADDPAGIWGRSWELVRVTLNRGDLPVPPRRGEPGGPPTLDLSVEGEISFQACNRSEGAVALEGDVLTATDGMFTTTAGCIGGGGEDLMVLDDVIPTMFVHGAEVALSGDRLTLTSMATTATFVAAGTPRGTTAAETGLVADGGADCLLGLRPLGEADAMGSRIIDPGPSDPPVIDGLTPTPGDGTWHLTAGDQVAEVRVPGTVVVDLVGERTEQVDLTGRGEATIWFGDGWVQVRWFPGTSNDGRCDSFDVTVGGPDEAANRDLAVELAKQVVASERVGAAEATVVPEPEEPAQAALPPAQTSVPTPDPDTYPGTSVPIVSVPLPDAAGCEFSFQEDAGGDWRWEGGPAIPLDPREPAEPVPAVVHAVDGATSVQVQSPIPTAPYLPGAGTTAVSEPVDDEVLGRVEIWTAPRTVQLRVAPGTEPCDGFAVTVQGGTEQQNRLTAVEVARSVWLGPPRPR